MRTLRSQLLLGLVLATGFLAFRVLYAIVFSGAVAHGVVILDIPIIRLSGPFSHVTLFGPVSIEGLFENLRLGLPFALSILGFSVIGSFIRPASFFGLASKAPHFGRLLTTLAIAWAQLPGLAQAISRIRVANRARGESFYRMVIPILETAVQRAVDIGNRLAIEVTKTSESPRLKILDAGVDLGPGDILVISGPTSSGKSNLLLSLAGIAQESKMPIALKTEISGKLGYVPQQPRSTIWGPRVSDEVPLPAGFGMDKKAEFETQFLSEGEAVQLTFERELAKKPQILLLDEPLPALDETAAAELVSKLEEFLAAGGIAVVVEHKPWKLNGLNPKHFHIEFGNLIPGPYQPIAVASPRKPATVGHELIQKFEFSEVEVSGRKLIQSVSLPIHQAQIIAIAGPNGCGKTTLLKAIMGSKPVSEIAFVPELVSDFFVTTSLADELERADRLSKVQNGFTQGTFESIVTAENLAMNTHPRDLSAGTQLALAISMQLSRKPRILLIDEPVKGFDQITKARIAESLKCVQETGTAIVLASHDEEFVSYLANTIYNIVDQRLIEKTAVNA